MRRIIVPLLIVALAAPPAHAAALQQVQRRLEQLLTRLSQQRTKLRLVRRKERRLLEQLEGIDRTKEQAERRLRELSADSRETETRQRRVAAQLTQTEQRLADRRGRLGGRLRDVYKYGRTGYADVLVGADDFPSFVTRWHLIATIVSADTQAIEAHAVDVQRYRQLHAALSQDQAYLKTLAAHATSRRREILAQEHAKHALLRRVQVERAAYERVVRELERNSRELETMIRRAQLAPHGPPGAEAHTRFAFLRPALGAITSGFGWRVHPLFGIRHFHTGVDIATVWGAPVLAAADGRVIYAGWFGGYGKIVVIDHGAGLSSLYAHLSTVLATTGDEVHRGQVIAHVGVSGYATGPHLHFEFRVNGRPVDPTKD